jgi:hypothetical protein
MACPFIALVLRCMGHGLYGDWSKGPDTAWHTPQQDKKRHLDRTLSNAKGQWRDRRISIFVQSNLGWSL